jgi:glucose/arabinose dehydrogenase
LLVLALTTLAANALLAAPADPSFLRLPPGFVAETLVEGIPNARSMALGSDGTLFVGTRQAGAVYAITGALSGRGVVIKLAGGLRMPNGVAFRDGALYVAEPQRILRWPAIESRLADPGPPEVIVADLPFKNMLHAWKYIAFGPDGLLYVPIGAPCNVCREPGYGVLLRMRPDGSGREVFATGIRNTVGFTWHPQTGELWFTDNGRDMLGDDVPACELNRAAKPGLDFGFPYCHAGAIPDPEFGETGKCADAVPPVQALGPHVAPLGVKFYTGEMFPAEYRGQVLIAEHGSWNRSKEAGRTGYRVTLVRLRGDAPLSYEPFIEGWLDGDTIRGRPVDLLVAPDGSLLVSDDQAGAIYRVRYDKRRDSGTGE